MTVRVEHWRREDGWRILPWALRKDESCEMVFNKEEVGWYCWVYSDFNFDDWMSENMTGEYECDFRFNGGDPMYTVKITSDIDAALFKLKWGIK